MRILVIEDDKEAAGYLVKGLRENGYVVDHAADGKEGLYLAMSESYDGMIIDRTLPNIDGLTIIQALRSAGNVTPVLILSALSKVDDRVKGLTSGGDDYMVKPYAFSELQARLDNLIRRSNRQGAQETMLKVGDLELDLVTRQVTRSGKSIDLKAKEFQLLEYFMRHAGQVITRTMLLEQVWDVNFDPQSNIVDVHVSHLRQKIDKGFAKPMLETLRGSGYRLKAA